MTVTVSSQSVDSFQQSISNGVNAFMADRNSANGAPQQAVSPFEILLGAWGACTNMTLQVYCQRKNWPLQRVVSTLNKIENGSKIVIEKKIQVWGDLSNEQVQRLKQVADKCPVNQFIMGPRGDRQLVTTIESQPNQ